MSEQATTLKAFVDALRPLAGKVELEDALRIVTRAALDIVPGQRSSIRVLDRTGRKVVCGAQAGDDSDAEPLALEASEAVLRRAVAEGAAQLVGDAAEGAPTDGKGAVRSILGVPLVTGGQLVGVLGITSREPHRFTEEHEAAAVLLATCAAPVVDRTRLAQLALCDELTLAYNERYLTPRLREEVSRSQRYGYPLSLLMMDLDGFRKVNEVHGRAAGDVALQRFADRVRATVRLSDVLVRLGGDEFALVATNTDRAAAAVVAERVRERMGGRPVLEDRHGRAIHLTVAVGIATWDGEETVESLVKQATAAVARATELGGNCVATSGEQPALERVTQPS